MMHAIAFRRVLACCLALMALTASGACRWGPDCKLYGTCEDSLFEEAKKLADNKWETCQRCLTTHCAEEEQRCSTDVACNFTSRCMLTRSPADYQQCVRELYEGGLTFGNERRHPWEGRPDEDAGSDLTFGECLHERCRSDCIEDPFACAKTFNGAESYSEYDISIAVAVRSYPKYDPLPQVSLRVCEDIRDAKDPAKFETVCAEEGVTDNRGVARLRVRQYIKAEALYLEIAAKKGDFPKTLYYPGRLGRTGLQLVPVYVVRGHKIALGNYELRRGAAVLEDFAQSLVLTDSCIWEKISVPGLRVSVEDAAVPQCHELPGDPCGDAGCTPCIWYARPKYPNEEFPDLKAERTDGTGAGIVGLDAGFYTIRVDRAESEPVGRRQIRMENGAMTIVRTWPPLGDLSSSSAEP